MSFFQQHPSIRICIAFGAGIVMGEQILYQPKNFGIVLLLIFFCYSIWFLAGIKVKYRFRHVAGIFLMGAVMLCGVFSIWFTNIRNQSNHISKLNVSPEGYELVLNENPVRKKKSWRVMADIRAVRYHGQWQTCTGKILVYIRDEENIGRLKDGSRLMILKKAEQLDTANSISEGYRKYLSRRGVDHRIFISKVNDVIKGREYPDKTKAIVSIMQSRTLSVLKNNIHGSDACALAEALLIGFREDMDEEWKNIYTRAGIVHVIAISGMHLGLLHIAMGWILDNLPLIRKNKICKAVIGLFFLWMFSLMCGATASVLRSAVMYSYLIVGKLLDRDGQVYNALAVSAIILLSFDPYLLWDAGFQLSYLAIIGIVSLQKPLNALWEIKNNALRKIWEMTAVTIAAQMMTLPLCLYYFHQFPNYFLLSNWIAIPLSTVILFDEACILLLSPFPILAEMVGKMASWLIELFNYCMKTVSQLPGSVSADLYASFTSTVVLYVIIGMIWVNALKNDKR